MQQIRELLIDVYEEIPETPMDKLFKWWNSLSSLQKLLVGSGVALGTIGVASTLRQKPPVFIMVGEREIRR